MQVIDWFYFVLFFLAFRYVKWLRIADLKPWTLSFAFVVKTAMAACFYYVYVYKTKDAAEPSDAMRFLAESKMLYNVFYDSPTAFFSLFTGIGDTAEMMRHYMGGAFIWDAGDFTFINDSRNTIRFHSIIHFISFGSAFVHFLVLSCLSLIGLVQLHIAIQSYSKLKPWILFAFLLLFPSLLFWTSGILKEPFLLIGLGFFVRGLLLKTDATKKRLIALGTGGLILILFKPYILICILPGIFFFVVYKYIFRFNMLRTIVGILLLIVLVVFSFPGKKQGLTEYLSRKQFDLENVGRGGIHVIDPGKNRFYYFKPEQYKNIKIEENWVELLHPSRVILLSGDQKNKPLNTYVNHVGVRWRIHIVMPGTNSYIATTPINNSFGRLLRNIPEAVANTYFRPLPGDPGSFLKYPAMLEVWALSCFLITALVFRRKIPAESQGYLVGFILFAFCLMLLIGWTTPVIGAIVRFRFPAQLALFIVGAMLIDTQRLNKKIIKKK